MRRIALLSYVVCCIAFRPAAGQQAPHDTVLGAVRALDLRARAVEVTSGVGMALRVVRLQVPANVPVTARGAILPLAQLKPGDIVRVSYGARPGGYVAYTIERVGRMIDAEAAP